MRRRTRTFVLTLASIVTLIAMLTEGKLAFACASENPFLASICITAFNFAPQGFLFAQGQLLPINQNQALFSLLGTTYGGNGQTTFALPDLRGRVPVGAGQGPGLSNRVLGETGGEEEVLLTVDQIPSHSHSATTTLNVSATARANSGIGNVDSPTGAVWARFPRDNDYSTGAPNVDMSPSAINMTASATTSVANAGGNQPHNNMPPFLVLNYLIAIQGIFPVQQ